MATRRDQWQSHPEVDATLLSTPGPNRCCIIGQLAGCPGADLKAPLPRRFDHKG